MSTFIQNMQTPKNGLILCFACHDAGVCNFGIHAEELTADNRVRALMRCPDACHASPGVAHGGWTAAVLDEVCGHVPIRLGSFAVTGKLNIEYRRPVPVGVEIEILAWAAERRQGRWKVVAELRVSGAQDLLARAEGLFIERDMGHYDKVAERQP